MKKDNEDRLKQNHLYKHGHVKSDQLTDQESYSCSTQGGQTCINNLQTLNKYD